MTDRQNVELTARQQALLLQGLRYIRSSVKLRREDVTSENSQERHDQLEELLQLSSLIEGSSRAEMAMQP